MVWVLTVLLLGSAIAWFAQLRRVRLLQADRLQLSQDLSDAQSLASALTGTDWQRSLHELLTRLVQSGACRSATLFSLAESGNLDLQTTACANGEQAVESVPEPVAHRAIESKSQAPLEPDGLLLPVIDDGESVGLLALRGADSARPAIQLVARFAAAALSAMKTHRRQFALSSTDGLTGLANHRQFQQILGIALGQAYLEGEPLGIILLDIDHFKQVNDTHGHLLGDLVLREIAYLLRREVPPGGIAARYGGEEMVVLLQGPLVMRAGEIAERLRQAIADHQIFDFATGSRLGVTVSLGVATYELGQGKSRLVARADEAMYASKRAGRNRVTIAPPENGTSHLFPS